METLRIGLVGTGGIGRTHIERINNTLQGGKVVACADPASAFGFSVAEKYGIKGFENPIDMINSPEIDAALRPDDGLRADLAQPAPQAVRRPLPERKADEKS